MRLRLPMTECVAVGTSVIYTAALSIYKRWLEARPDVVGGTPVGRALAVIGQPGYWWFLLLGFACILFLLAVSALLACNGGDALPKIVGIGANSVLLVVLVMVFWDPVFTTFVVVAFVAFVSATALS